MQLTYPPKDLKNQAWLSHGRNNVHDHAYSFSSKGARAAAAGHRPNTLDNSHHCSLPLHSGFCMVPASRGHWLPVQSLEWQGYNQLNILIRIYKFIQVCTYMHWGQLSPVAEKCRRNDGIRKPLVCYHSSKRAGQKSSRDAKACG